MAGAASWVMADFRFGHNDGDQSAYTFIAAKNANISWVAGTAFFLQAIVQNNGTADGTSLKFRIKYRKNGGAFTTLSSASAQCRLFDSANIVQGGDTVQRLGSGTFVVDNNAISDTSSDTGTLSVPQLQETECLACLLIVASDVVAGDIFEFEWQLSPGTLFTTYPSPLPTVTVVTAGNASRQFQSMGQG